MIGNTFITQAIITSKYGVSGNISRYTCKKISNKTKQKKIIISNNSNSNNRNEITPEVCNYGRDLMFKCNNIFVSE